PVGALLREDHRQARMTLEDATPDQEPERPVGEPGALSREKRSRAGQVPIIRGRRADMRVDWDPYLLAGRPDRLIARVVVKRQLPHTRRQEDAAKPGPVRLA